MTFQSISPTSHILHISDNNSTHIITTLHDLNHFYNQQQPDFIKINELLSTHVSPENNFKLINQPNDKIFIIDTFEVKSFKTKDLFTDLKNFDYESALFIYSEKGLDNNFKLASSNIPRISTINQKGINVKDLITFDKIFIEQNSINEITERLS